MLGPPCICVCIAAPLSRSPLTSWHRPRTAVSPYGTAGSPVTCGWVPETHPARDRASQYACTSATIRHHPHDMSHHSLTSVGHPPLTAVNRAAHSPARGALPTHRSAVRRPATIVMAEHCVCVRPGFCQLGMSGCVRVRVGMFQNCKATS